MRRTAGIVSVFAAVVIAGCGEAAYPAQVDLPVSVSPGWVRQSYAHSQPPPSLPNGAVPDCWSATYTKQGSAVIWVCGYRVEGSAFDAVQRTRSEADAVHFQTGKYLVIAKWTGVSRAEITALIRAIQSKIATS